MCEERNKAEILKKFKDAFEKGEILEEAGNFWRDKLRELWKSSEVLGIPREDIIKVYEEVRRNNA